MVKYYKKVSKISPWTQPVLTSNGVWGGNSFAVDSPSYVSGYYPFYAFDGSTTGTAVAINSTNPYKMYFPTPVNISNIKSVGYHDSYWLLNSYRIAYSDDDITYTNATEILTATNYTINANIDKAVGCHKYWEIVPITCSSNGWSVKELYIQAQELSYTWEECTKTEYDQSPEDERKIVTNIYSIFSVDKFYKLTEVENPWEQPILTSEGTIGGTEYGVTANAFMGDSNYTPKNAFDNNLSTYWITDRFNTIDNITFYSPVPIRPSQVRLRGQSGYAPPRSFEIQVSNDNSIWTTLYSGSLSNSMPYDITCNTNATDFYNYIRIYITSKYTLAGGNLYALIGDITITATQQVSSWLECTKIEYEQLADNLRKQERGLYAPKLNNKSYLGGGQ